MFYTYAHTRNDTNKIFYIGKGNGKRAWSKFGRNNYWNKIVNKHGFTAQVLAEWKDEKEAFDHEILLIACFKDMGYELVNMTNGGDNPPSKKGITGEKSHMFGKKHTAATLAKMSVLQSGENNGFYGKKHNEQTLKKISETSKGRGLGAKNPSFVSEILATNIETGEQKIFCGAKALNEYGFSHCKVYDCLNGKRNKHKGHTFERIYGKVPPLSAAVTKPTEDK